MCGIAGFIGLSKNSKATNEIMTKLFDFLEFRGIDAAGVWAAEAGKKGKVFYHKEPIRSSEFIKKTFWKKIRRAKLNILLAHARATSKGGGHADTNGNNHPFVSLDKRIGMVHNGTIDEAYFLSKKYQCFSQTDSEVILRIFEKGMEDKMELEDVPSRIAHRLGGIKDVWSTITEGAMAVAIGEREDDSQRNLFLFRNDQRPLWIADLRSCLGQVFFFSSPDVWYRAMEFCSDATKSIVKDQKLIEIPPNEVWALHVDDDNPHISQGQFYRFQMDVKKTGKDWEKEFFMVQPPKTKISVVTELDVDEEVTSDIYIDRSSQKEKYDSRYSQGGTEHEIICEDIMTLTSNIKITLTNFYLEGTIPSQLYQDILESLESTKIDLQGTLRLIGE
jgi:glucosamine 6-phosphate synthetase-like amidotransferase/phosphosugar isomerase protein